ncbi:hypothetical protein BG95_08565 [Thermosipho sp. 1063]|uniref:hypothetical protein n=1 Tax=unclassified Thermosipho (in: thermotogales) TaxID=2676525 RepID=UPI0009492487|nr:MULTISPECIES: hypothetical protein [unclassified Thermosipho (in: thermotogales)]ANQ54669.1 hypothetical protein Y592_08655 [Thermosipho sp. 1070]APT73067.1 hypothetical protein BG95_08565 [Thermosipho sp. 1063]OOC42328.1 hypothetical protein XO08_08635 [Thermosipho sp. 1074]
MNEIFKDASFVFLDKNLKITYKSTNFTKFKSYYVVDLPEYNVYLPVQLEKHKIVKVREKFVCDPFNKINQKVEILSSLITNKNGKNVSKIFYVSHVNTEVEIKVKFYFKLVPEEFRSFIIVLRDKEDVEKIYIRIFSLIEKSGEMVFYLKFDGRKIVGKKYLELYSCGERLWSENIEIIKNTYGGVELW